MKTVAELVVDKQISRVCHLTPYENLLQIVLGNGLRSTLELRADERASFSQQDLARFDGHEDHICCSIQYPNTWYLRRRKQDSTPLQRLFPDWVCVLIDPIVLAGDNVLFSPRNAAAASGGHLCEGVEGFERMYAPTVAGARGYVFGRDLKPKSVPTDDQAEVLVPKAIPLSLARSFAVADDAQAARVYANLDLLGVDEGVFEIVVAPKLFSTTLSESLRAGTVPVERPWAPGDA